MKLKYIDFRVEDVFGDGDCLYYFFIWNNYIYGFLDGFKKFRRQFVEYLEFNLNILDGMLYKDFLCLLFD